MKNPYQQVQNATDSPVQLSERAVRSILLYCKDWNNKNLSLQQRLQSIKAGQVLCDCIVEFMRNDLPEREQKLLMTIFTRTSIDLHECEFDTNKSLYANERALIKILDILNKKQ